MEERVGNKNTKDWWETLVTKTYSFCKHGKHFIRPITSSMLGGDMCTTKTFTVRTTAVEFTGIVS